MKEIDLNNLKDGYFILYVNTNSYGKLIKKYQLRFGYPPEDARFTHIELYLGENFSINPVFPKIKINDDLRSLHGGKYAKIIKPRIPNYDERRKSIQIHGCKRINTIYGLGIIWFLIKDKIKTNIFSVIGDFCSELAGWVILKEFSKDISDYEEYLPVNYDQLMPADFSFYEAEYFEVIAEGYIPEYK